MVVLCTSNWLGSPWCVAEAMMARERGKPVFLLAAPEVVDGRQVKGAGDEEAVPQIPDFLKDTQFISLVGLTTDDALERLWRGLEAEGLKDDFLLPARPYPGLEPFRETDAAVFFGRDDEITRVRGILNRRRKNNAKGFILVLGASGCGKSSLVRAGVLPRLRPPATAGEAPQDWVIAAPVLGRDGLDGLSRSLASAFDGLKHSATRLLELRSQIEAAADSEDAMRAATRALRRLANDLLVAHASPQAKLLLVLDQLEEVFGTAARLGCPGAAAAVCWKRRADDASPLVVLATMRSDFLNAFQLFPGAAERYEEVTLDPDAQGPLRRADRRPGRALRSRPRPGSHRAAGGGHPSTNDALPLLAFTLEQLYAKGMPMTG